MKRIFLPILLGVLMISAVLPSAVVFAGNDVPRPTEKTEGEGICFEGEAHYWYLDKSGI